MATTTATTLSTAADSQLTTLRAELKQWEKTFAEANGGKKAGRHDIKQNPEIAAKYKAYGRLRALEESSASTQNAGHEKHEDVEKTPSKSDQHRARTKRKYAALTADDGAAAAAEHGYTPRKARREITTPAKSRVASDPLNAAVLDPYDSPSVFRRLFSPTTHRQQQEYSPLPLKSSIGPTPQRNGKILGLFDMLSASGGSTATPSAKRVAALDQAIIQTPSRSKVQKLGDIPEMADKEGEDEEEDESEVAMGRTPASSSKHLYLERLFATPTTLRFASMMEQDDDDDEAEASQRMQVLAAQAEDQPEKNNPLGSDTPSFLRRSNSGRYISNNSHNGVANHALSPVGVRKHQRFSNGKGLTALVQGLRDMEKERMEDEWDILNEIEAEQNVQVGDSQVPQANDNNQTEHGGGKIWKKKTQKRTTRLVKMKPVMQVKNKPSRIATISNAPAREDKDKEEVDEQETENDQPNTRTLRERKQDTNQQDDDNDNDEEDSDAMDSDNSSDKDFESDPKQQQQQQQQQRTKPSSFTEKIKAAFSSIPISSKKSKDDNDKKKDKKEKEKENANDEKAAKRRKINPDAHANYRSLKIRSKGQGRFRKGGGGGRFGRR